MASFLTSAPLTVGAPRAWATVAALPAAGSLWKTRPVGRGLVEAELAGRCGPALLGAGRRKAVRATRGGCPAIPVAQPALKALVQAQE